VETLAEYYSEVGVRCPYLHSEVTTLDRIKILRDLRRGEFDVLIGINLLREGLDLPGARMVWNQRTADQGRLSASASGSQTMRPAGRSSPRAAG